jgi:hypothetical protein
VKLLERATRVLDSIQRDKDVPEPLITVHEPDCSNASLRLSAVEPFPDIYRVESMFCGKLDELLHDVLENPGALRASFHGLPTVRVFVRETLES